MKIFIRFLAIIFMLACGKPAPPLDQDRLIAVLVDVHIVEGLTNSHHPINLRDSLSALYLQQILEVHDLSQKEFEDAMAHMHADPPFLKEVYQEVLLKINEKSRQMDGEEERRRNEENQFRN